MDTTDRKAPAAQARPRRRSAAEHVWSYVSLSLSNIYIYIYMYIHMCIYVYMYIHVVFFFLLLLLSYVCIYVCMCVYIYIYIYIYTYIHVWCIRHNTAAIMIMKIHGRLHHHMCFHEPSRLFGSTATNFLDLSVCLADSSSAQLSARLPHERRAEERGIPGPQSVVHKLHEVRIWKFDPRPTFSSNGWPFPRHMEALTPWLLPSEGLLPARVAHAGVCHGPARLGDLRLQENRGHGDNDTNNKHNIHNIIIRPIIIIMIKMMSRHAPRRWLPEQLGRLLGDAADP